MQPAKYRKRPVEIEAMQFIGTNKADVLRFLYPNLSQDAIDGATTMSLPIIISTLEGDMAVSLCDWIIRGVKGEFYPCKPDIFEATYEKVDTCNQVI